jgi:hypothetical protein
LYLEPNLKFSYIKDILKETSEANWNSLNRCFNFLDIMWFYS